MLLISVLFEGQLYNTVLFAVITMLCFRSIELVNLRTGSLYPLANIFPFPHCPSYLIHYMILDQFTFY